MSRSTVFITTILLAGACTLGGCGRRGPLEPPPGTPVEQSKSTVLDPSAPSDAPQPSLARNTYDRDLVRDDRSTLATPITIPKRPFILDPLL